METKWSGKSTRQLGNGYKLSYTSENTRKNGVGVVVNRQFAHKVMKVNRYCDRIITVQVIIGKKVWNIISVYASRVERPQNEKEAFWKNWKQS